MNPRIRKAAEIVGLTIVALGLPFNSHVARAQYPPNPYPVLLVDSAVRARLVEEWEPKNRYQHERGYCVRFTTDHYAAGWFTPATVVYTLVEVLRAGEVGASPTGLRGLQCPDRSDITLLHTHPPLFCEEEDGGPNCTINIQYSYQCFPSPTDAMTLQRSSMPFALIQCDEHAIVPYWRKT